MFGNLQSDVKERATKRSVELLRDSNESLIDAYSYLLKDQYKEAEKSFRERTKIINDNIFTFTTERGGKK